MVLWNCMDVGCFQLLAARKTSFGTGLRASSLMLPTICRRWSGKWAQRSIRCRIICGVLVSLTVMPTTLRLAWLCGWMTTVFSSGMICFAIWPAAPFAKLTSEVHSTAVRTVNAMFTMRYFSRWAMFHPFAFSEVSVDKFLKPNLYPLNPDPKSGFKPKPRLRAK